VKRWTDQHVATQTYLKAGTGINGFDRQGKAPIHKAIENGDVKWAAMLLGSDADPLAPTKDKNRKQPIHIAAERGNIKMMELLLAREDVDVNAKDAAKRTALVLALQNDHEDVVNLLMKRKNLDPNIKNTAGRTILRWSCNKDSESTTYLLERGDADINSHYPTDSATPAIRACQNCFEDIANLLLALDGLYSNARDACEERIAFVWTRRKGDDSDERVLNFLVPEKYIDINARDSNGKAALVLQCDTRHQNTAQLQLFGQKVESTARWRSTHRGRTVLMSACEKGYEGIARLLLSREDCDMNAKDKRGNTALILE
jgi:ankyrin repeat protein